MRDENFKTEGSAPLAGKKILLIAPCFFGYQDLIRKKLVEMGGQVTFYSDRPGEDFVTKALVRIDRRLLEKRTNAYYDEIICDAKKNFYDNILIIRGEAISEERIKTLKASCPNSKITLYLWDSLHYNPNALKIAHIFDDVLTFDIDDHKRINGAKFQPLFFSDDWLGIKNISECKPKYDICFVGTVHTDRYKILNEIENQCKKANIKYNFYYYYPSRTLAFFRSLIDPGFRRFSKKINFDSISFEDVMSVFSDSRSVLDINRPKQGGLTVRTFEVIGARRLLVTTNPDVKKYDFYSPSRVKIIDRNCPSMDFLFEDMSPPVYSESILEYSIEKWIEKVLGLPR